MKEEEEEKEAKEKKRKKRQEIRKRRRKEEKDYNEINVSKDFKGKEPRKIRTPSKQEYGQAIFTKERCFAKLS